MTALPVTSIGTPAKGITPPARPAGRAGFLSDVIVELGFADRATVEQAVRAARSPGATMAGVLVEMGAITEDQLAHARAERHGLLYVDLDAYGVDPKAANLLAPGAARQHRCVPVGFAGSRVILAVVDPADAPGAGALTGLAQHKLLPAVATAAAIDALIDRLPLPEPPAGELAAVSDAEEPTAAPEPAAADADVPEPTAEDTTASAEEEYELRARLSRAEAQLEEARVRSSEHHRELATARMELEARTVELEVLRTKLTDVESDAVRARAEAEHSAREARALRAQAESEERRRRLLEDRLAKFEAEVFAAERTAQELRQAQLRLRGLLSKPDD